MLTLEDILERYYKANQLSRSMNMLDVLKPGADKSCIRPIKCVCDVFRPSDGWSRDIEKAGSDQSKCFYCKNEIKKLFPDYEGSSTILSTPMPEEPNCIYCYKFMGSIFRTGEGMLVLAGTGRRKERSKNV